MTPDLTIFAIPKPFTGHTGIIQENALSSWVRLPWVEVILIGNDDGVGEAAQRFGARHEPEVSKTDLGTPLLDSAFQIATTLATSERLCYANADIMLFEDLIEAINEIPFPNYLVVAQRTNMDVKESISLEDSVAVDRFLREARRRGILEPPWASDIFVFPRTTRLGLESFAVGRPGWDNWLIWKARNLRVPVVDVTPSVLVVHQNHDYGHVPRQRGRAWEGPEADRNLQLVGDPSTLWNLDRATHIVEKGRVRRARGWRYFRGWMLGLPGRFPWLRRPLAAVRALFRVIKTVIGHNGQRPNGG